VHERLDGRRCLATRHVAIAAFLEQAAEFRMPLLESFEGRERVGDAAKITLAHRHHVQSVAVLGMLAGERLGCGQCRCELLLLHQFPDAQHLRFHR
jgi:hypothetical protein